jgi:thiamine-phosphate pyrophosphorylase
MADDQPQIYLISPATIERDTFAGALASVLDAHAVACFRLALSGADEDEISRDADAMREVCHARDVPIVIERHFRLAGRLGLDGVHLPDAAKSIRDARKELGADAIVGCYCGASRHAGLSAGEAGADYVAFGPVATGSLGDGKIAEQDLFAWWSEMIEVPVVAEGGMTPEMVAALAPVSDFLGISEIWKDDAPATALKALLSSL